MNEKKRYKKGHFTTIGMILGILFGIPLGMLIGKIGVGPAIGVAIGLALGSAVEKYKNPNPIEPTKEEKEKQKKTLIIALISGAVLFAIATILFFILYK